jgi:hypothetical protein
MYDDLFENDPKIQQWRAAWEAKGEVRGQIEGQTQELRNAIVSYMKVRFPSLVPLAQKRVARLKEPATLNHLLESAYTAPDEAAIRVLLGKRYPDIENE